MSLKNRITEDMKIALKSGDKVGLGVLRMMRARMLEREVELRSKHGLDYDLEDSEAITVLSGYAKQRKDSIDGFRRGGREEQAAREEAELAIVETYLPEQIGEEEILLRLKEAIAEAGATSPRDLGEVMKRVMPPLKGRADGKTVNRLARDLLAEPEDDRS